MRTTRRTLIFLVVSSFLWGTTAPKKNAKTANSKGQVSIVVRSLPDPTKRYPDSRLYVAEVRDTSTTPIKLQPIQMPGGYLGSGTFFPCLMETRSKNGKWATLKGPGVAIAEFHNPPFRDAVLVPGENREVCRALLPHEGGTAGACVRFRLKLGWSKSYSYLLSDSFQISQGSELHGCP